MSLRTRLSCLNLEDRANPSGPDLIDPYTGADGTAPVVTATPDTTQVAVDIGSGIVAATTPTNTTTSPDTTNSIYKTDMLDLIYVQQ
jgi:hypothetical protein